MLPASGPGRACCNAAKRYKIVPVGFIAGQLQSERSRSARSVPAAAAVAGS